MRVTHKDKIMNDVKYVIEGEHFGDAPEITNSKYTIKAIRENRPLIKKIAAAVKELPTADASVRKESSVYDSIDMQRIQRVIREIAGYRIIFDTHLSYCTHNEARVVASCKLLTPEGYVLVKTSTAQCSVAEIKNAEFGSAEDALLWAESRALRYIMRDMGVLPFRPNHEYTDSTTVLLPKHEEQKEVISADTHLQKRVEVDSPYVASTVNDDGVDGFDGSVDDLTELDDGDETPEQDKATTKTAPRNSEDAPVETKHTSPAAKVETKAAVKQEKEEEAAVETDEPQAAIAKVVTKKASPASAISRLAARGKKPEPQPKKEVEAAPAKEAPKASPVKEQATDEKPAAAKSKAVPEKAPEPKKVETKPESKKPATKPVVKRPIKGISLSGGMLSSLTKKAGGNEDRGDKDSAPKRGRKRGSKAAEKTAKKVSLSLDKLKQPPKDEGKFVAKKAPESLPDKPAEVRATPSKKVAPRAKIKGIAVPETSLSTDEIRKKLKQQVEVVGLTLGTIIQDTFNEGTKEDDMTSEDWNRLYNKYVKGA